MPSEGTVDVGGGGALVSSYKNDVMKEHPLKLSGLLRTLLLRCHSLEDLCRAQAPALDFSLPL